MATMSDPVGQALDTYLGGCNGEDADTGGSDGGNDIEGCMDMGADNYDPNAEEPCDDCCEYLGCTDPLAENYDSSANVDDGSCTYPPASYTVWRNGEVLLSGLEDTMFEDSDLGYGMTYCYQVQAVDMGEVLATSNEACATTMDMAGCTDSEATNYNPDANIDDGSCVYFELEYFTDLPVETGESSLVIIQNADLEVGDEIGLFDMNGVLESVEAGQTPVYGEILVGAGVWTGDQLEIVGVESVDLSQFGGPTLNGYVAGNSIVYKVYKSSEAMVYNADVSYQAGTGTWGDILTVVSQLNPVLSMTQDIELNPYTFNMCSANVIPETADIATVFDGIDLLLVKNDGSDYYVPSYNVDQIGSFDNREGYKVFLNGANQQVMNVTGLPVGEMSVELMPYMMNIMPFLPDGCMATSDVFAGYEDQILTVKNDDSDFFVPSYGVETLSEMCPGEGYAIFLNGADGIDFTYPMGMALYSDDMMDDYKLRTRTDAVTKTGLSHLVLITDISGEVQAGDQLRAYANDVLVGEINIVSEHLEGYPIDLVAVGGADLTEWGGPELSGYRSGDAIELRLYSESRNVELRVSTSLDNNAYGNDTEMSIGSVVVLNENAIITSFELTQNYPNPFNPSTTIDYNIHSSGYVSLNVYDVMGRLVRTLVDEYKEAGNANGYSVTWNGLDNLGNKVSTGVYIYSLQAQGVSTTKKMVLMK